MDLRHMHTENLIYIHVTHWKVKSTCLVLPSALSYFFLLLFAAGVDPTDVQ